VQMTYSQFFFDSSDILKIAVVYVIFAFLVGVSAGLFPALHFSSFRPAAVLRGDVNSKGFSRIFLRKALIVTQFAFTIIILIGSITLYKQMTFMYTADMGMDLENKYLVNLKEVSYPRFQQEIQSIPGVKSVTGVMNPPIIMGIAITLLHQLGSEEEQQVNLNATDENLVDILGLEILAGRNFSKDFSTENENSIIINEKAVELFGYSSPADAVGKIIYTRSDKEQHIIGVLKDFHYRSLENQIDPLILRYNPQVCEFAIVDTYVEAEESTLLGLEESWKKLGSVYPLDARLYDKVLEEDNPYAGEIGALFGVLSGFVLLIACLGLLGMTTYNMELRVKEVSVRRVIGATTAGLTYLLSKDFIKLVVIAICIGVPIAWIACNMILQFFAQRISVGVGVISLSIFIVLMISVLTVGSQTIKAALTNPVDILRRE
ncbi:ABC transporter permease, partial [candidate division KSB1 bacterium]